MKRERGICSFVSEGRGCATNPNPNLGGGGGGILENVMLRLRTGDDNDNGKHHELMLTSVSLSRSKDII